MINNQEINNPQNYLYFIWLNWQNILGYISRFQFNRMSCIYSFYKVKSWYFKVKLCCKNWILFVLEIAYILILVKIWHNRSFHKIFWEIFFKSKEIIPTCEKLKEPLHLQCTSSCDSSYSWTLFLHLKYLHLNYYHHCNLIIG